MSIVLKHIGKINRVQNIAKSILRSFMTNRFLYVGQIEFKEIGFKHFINSLNDRK